ncbi:glycoside hydrolase family 92 protein, partial [Vibrio parahaemolyticus]|nr:glycoside hydrolase family 92 protein [Vibrio parahaemolyticus]
KFTITSENNSQESIYVKSVAINGKPLDANFTFKHSEIKAGGELHFVMTGDKQEALQAQ